MTSGTSRDGRLRSLMGLSKYSTFSSTLESRISLRARELADGVKSG